MAKREMIEANLRLVILLIAKKLHQPWLTGSLDLIQERQYRPDAGGGQVQASAWLQVLDLRHLVDSPGHHPLDRRPGAHHPYSGARSKTINKMNRISRQNLCGNRLGWIRPAGDAHEMPRGEDPQDHENSKEPISMETPIGDDDDSHLGDFIEDAVTMAPSDAAMYASLREATKGARHPDPANEAKVLRMRFGIEMNTDHALEEVGKQFDVTRERIRQIEAGSAAQVAPPHPFRTLEELPRQRTESAAAPDSSALSPLMPLAPSGFCFCGGLTAAPHPRPHSMTAAPQRSHFVLALMLAALATLGPFSIDTFCRPCPLSPARWAPRQWPCNRR